MKKTIKYVVPWLSAAAIGGAIAFAPVAGAASVGPSPTPSAAGQSGEDPLVPTGPDPSVPGPLGFYNPNLSDNSGTTNPSGGVDLPS